MPTEPSEPSAISRLVNLAESGATTEAVSEDIELEMSAVVSEVVSDAVTSPHADAPKSRAGIWLTVFAVVVIGSSVVGGYLLAKQGEISDTNASMSADVTTEIDTPTKKGIRHSTNNQTPANTQVQTPANARVLVLTDDLEEEIAPQQTVPGDIDPEIAKKTGLNIVEPIGANVSLDGHFIGIVPLRVRNLLPGLHSVDLNGVDGFFNEHVEIKLAAGESQEIRIRLKPLDSNASKDSESLKQSKDSESSKQSKDSESLKQSKDSQSSKHKKAGKTQTDRSRKNVESSPSRSEKAKEVLLGTLRLGSKPPCEISIDGRKTGTSTPQRSIQLPEGIHRVVLTNKDRGIRKSFKVRIKAGRTTSAIQDLRTDL